MHKQDYAPDFGALGKTPLPIELGGTFADNAQQALINLGVASVYDLDVADGMAKSTPQNFVNPTNIPNKYLYGVTVDGPKLVQFNSTAEFTITNFDSSTKYIVSSTVGNAVLQGDKIYYTAPDNQTEGGFTVNGNYIEVGIGNLLPLAPVIISPISGASDQKFPLTVTASSFALQTTLITDSHESSDWEVSENGTFTKIVASSYNDVVNKTVWVISGLPIGKIYYIRTRHKGILTGWSEWGAAVSVITETTWPIGLVHGIIAPPAVGGSADFPEVSSGFGFSKVLDNFYGSSYALGSTISLNAGGDVCLVGAPLTDTDNSGAAFVFTKKDGYWKQTAKLTPSRKLASAYFGYFVIISPDGTECFVSAPAEASEDGTLSGVGAVYVYQYENGIWTESQKIRSVIIQTQLHGTGIAISNDGQVLAIGALGDYEISQNSGAVFIYQKQNGSWVNTAKLMEPAYTNFNFGSQALALNGNGSICVVGHFRGKNNLGLVYVFFKDDYGNWSARKTILNPLNGYNVLFGSAVAISGDGNTIAIGAFAFDKPSETPLRDTGAAYIYKRVNDEYELEAELIAGEIKADDWFGRKLALSSDGKVCVVSAPNNDLGTSGDTGIVYVYVKDKNGIWSQVNKLRAQMPSVNNYFGSDVALSKDGSICAIGQSFDTHAPVGMVSIFDNVPTTAITRQLPSGLTQTIDCPDKTNGYPNPFSPWFGYGVRFSGDGNTCAVVSIYYTVYQVTAWIGAVYIYKKSGGTWTKETRLTIDNPGNTYWHIGFSMELNYDGSICVATSLDQQKVLIFRKTANVWAQEALFGVPSGETAAFFGKSCAISDDGNILFVGANGNPVNAGIPGAVFVFRYENNTWVFKQKLIYTGNPNGWSALGNAMSYSSSSKTLAVVDTYSYYHAPGFYEGWAAAVLIYKEVNGQFVFQNRVTPTNPAHPDVKHSIAISENGKVIAVGMPNVYVAFHNERHGLVYLLEQDPDGVWYQASSINDYPEDVPAADTNYIGSSVALSEDGQVLVVGNKIGSDYSDKVDSDEGAAFVYVRQGKSWVLHKRFYNPTKETSAVFGYSVDVTRDGTQIVVGAYGEDHPVPEGTDLGSIYFYA